MTDAVARAPIAAGRPPMLTSGLSTTSIRRSRNLSTSRAPSGTSMPPRFFGLRAVSTTISWLPASLLTPLAMDSRLRKSVRTCCALWANSSFSRLPRRPKRGCAETRAAARSAISLAQSRVPERRADSRVRPSLTPANLDHGAQGTGPRRGVSRTLQFSYAHLDQFRTAGLAFRSRTGSQSGHPQRRTDNAQTDVRTRARRRHRASRLAGARCLHGPRPQRRPRRDSRDLRWRRLHEQQPRPPRELRR